MIINPLAIYLIHVADAIKFAVAFIIILCVGVILLNWFMWDSLAPYDPDYEEQKARCMKTFKRATIALFALIAFEVFMPNSKVLTTMYIAKYVTVENVNMSIDAIKSATDYIINAINGIK